MAIDNKEVYLTGGTGFIGGAIVHSLQGKYSTHPLSRPTITSHIATLQFSPGSDLIHAAARVHMMHERLTNPLNDYRRANRDITLALARKGLDLGVKKFIFISSLMVLGPPEISGSFINGMPKPNEPYGISKWEAEQGLVEIFSRQEDARCIILRLPMVYGPGNKGNMLPLLKAANLSIPLPLAKTRGKRSMVYIGNVCSAIETILRDNTGSHPAVETYVINDCNNLTSGELYSLIYRAFHEKNGTFSMPEWLLRAGGNLGSWLEEKTEKSMMLNRQNISRLFDAYSFSSEAFCQDYNWTPPYTPEEGIQKTVEWYKNMNSSVAKPREITH